MIWTDKERNALFNLQSRGKSMDECAAIFGDILDEPVSPEDLSLLWVDMRTSGWIKKKRWKKKALSRHDDPIEPSDTATARHKLRQANLMHLLDLKRAGHSPTRTELKISSEGAGIRLPTAEIWSYMGSSAASCVEGF
jgi:hypothetical protein